MDISWLNNMSGRDVYFRGSLSFLHYLQVVFQIWINENISKRCGITDAHPIWLDGCICNAVKVTVSDINIDVVNLGVRP